MIIRFPGGFAPVSKLPAPVDAPSPPTFPQRPSPLSLALGGSHSLLPVVHRPLLTAALAAELSVWNPTYIRLDAASSSIIGRQTIRHGEHEVSGDPFTVRCPEAGQHEVTWEVHAANLGRRVCGTWSLTCVAETSGDPIRSMDDLQNLIAGLSPDDEGERD